MDKIFGMASIACASVIILLQQIRLISESAEKLILVKIRTIILERLQEILENTKDFQKNFPLKESFPMMLQDEASIKILELIE